MKLSFKIEPATVGFTEQMIHPDYSNLSFQLINDKSKGKFKVSGDIVLKKDDYNFFINDVTADYIITCYGNGGTFFTSIKEMINITNNNESLKQISLSLNAETEYENEEFKNIDTKYNINDLTPETFDLNFQIGQTETSFSEKVGTIKHSDQTITGWTKPGWVIKYVDNLTIIDLFPYPDESTYSGDVYYIRQTAFGYYLDGVRYEPPYTGTWIYLSLDVSIDGVLYPKYRADLDPDNYVLTGSNHPYTKITNDIDFYTDIPIIYEGVTRKVTDVIEHLFGEMGLSSIAFDNTGTTTDSFYSFKTFTNVGSSLTFESISSNKPYNHMLIMNLTDFIPADDGTQKDVPASQSMISLKTILDYFGTIGFEWHLENRLGTYYFKLTHVDHKSLSSGNPDLSNYKGVNYMRYSNIYEQFEPKYKKFSNETICSGLDFKGTYAVFENIYGIENILSFNTENIYLDLDDIITRGEDVYSDTDDYNFILIAGQQGSSQDFVRNAVGEMTGYYKNNSEFSFSYLIENMINELPDNQILVNGGTLILSTSSPRLTKMKKYNVSLPIDNINEDFEVDKYVVFHGNNAEINEISQNVKDNICKLTLKL